MSRLTNKEQAQHLVEFFENLTPKQQRRLFVIMFNELQIQEFVDCYLEGEDEDEENDPDGEFRVFWAHTGESLTDGLD